MKIRNGFVSNSSSSSFIISKNKKSDKKVTVEIELDLDDLLDKTISNYDELDEYFFNYSFCKNYEDLSKYEKIKYDKMKKELDNGNEIFIVEVSNEADYNNWISRYFYYHKSKLEDAIKNTKGLKFIEGLNE